jgi:hypothetical protein
MTTHTSPTTTRDNFLALNTPGAAWRGGPHGCVAASVTISSAWSLNQGRLLAQVVAEHYPATVNEMSSSSNASNIALNRQALYQAECRVERNKTQAYLIRSVVEENHDSIMKNYHAAFRGNRNLANANTDDLFRNRQMLIRCANAGSDVHVNFREAKINEAKIDFLEHRADLNARVLVNPPPPLLSSRLP